MSDVFQMYFSWFLFFYYYTTEVVTLLSLFAQLWIISLFPSSFLSGHTLWKNDFKSPIDIIANEALLFIVIFEFSRQKYYILLLFEVLRQKWPGLAQNWLMILFDNFLWRFRTLWLTVVIFLIQHWKHPRDLARRRRRHQEKVGQSHTRPFR